MVEIFLTRPGRARPSPVVRHLTFLEVTASFARQHESSWVGIDAVGQGNPGRSSRETEIGRQSGRHVCFDGEEGVMIGSDIGGVTRRSSAASTSTRRPLPYLPPMVPGSWPQI